MGQDQRVKRGEAEVETNLNRIQVKKVGDLLGMKERVGSDPG